MALADCISQTNLFPINQTIENVAPSEPINNDGTRSLSTIEIPLLSSHPILRVSSNAILANERTKKKNQLVLINDHLQRFSIPCTLNETIIDTLWYEIQQTFLLLTSTKVYTYDPNTKIIKIISDIKPTDRKPFKCFTILNNKQCSLLIGYDEWEAKFLEKWEENNENNCWKLIKQYPLNLTSDEFLGNILTFDEDNCLNLALTIYNDFTNQWRMELRHIETSTCFERILLRSTNSCEDYRMIYIGNVQLNFKWMIYSQFNNNIMIINSQWEKSYFPNKFPIRRMAQFKKNNLIIRTTNEIDIRLIFKIKFLLNTF